MSDSQARRYLLGLCSEDERQSLERQYLADAAAFDDMLAVENELAYDYAQGRLTPEERRGFEETLMKAPGQRGRVRLAELALPKFAAAPREERPPAGVLAWWQRPAVAGLALAAMLALAAGASWLAVSNARLREAQRQAAVAEVVAPAPSPTPSQPRLVVSTVLLPGRLRNDATGPRVVVLPPTADILRIEALLPAAPPAGGLRGALRDADGRELWSGMVASTANVGSRVMAAFEIPAGVIAAGDYELVVASPRDGRFEDLAEFYLTITKPAVKQP